MNALQRRAYWRKNVVIMRSLERKYAKQIKNVLIKQVDKIKIDNTDFYSDELLDIYKRMYKESVPKFANAQFRSMRKLKQFGGGVEWTAFVNEWLATNAFSLVSTVFNNYRDVIIKIIQQATTEAVEQGLGVDETTRLITERLTAFKDGLAPGFLAERIVRTEIMRAANLGHMKGAEALPYQVKKVWVSAKDHRTRRMPKDLFDHWVLDGVEKELDEPFTQTGKNGVTIQAQQPGDLMSGQDKKSTAAFTINCRCTIGFVAKRDANGKLIMK